MGYELDGDQRVARLAARRVRATLPFQADDLAGARARRNGDFDGAAGRQVDARLVAARELLERDGGGGGDVLAPRLLRPAVARTRPGPAGAQAPEIAEDV